MVWDGHVAARVAEAADRGANLGVGVQRWGSSLAGHFQKEGLRVIVRRHCGIFVAGNVEDEVLANRLVVRGVVCGRCA